VRAFLTRVASRGGVAVLCAGTALAVMSTLASADSASDSRATFHDGNVTTCAAIGFASDTQLPVSPDNANHSDANVSGVVKTNAGTIQNGVGQEVDITITGTNVLIDAVVVKGGNGYNEYTNPSVLPPQLPPDQHYIAPLNDGGNVPAISHWFVCYHLGSAEEHGSLLVAKTVVPPNGTPVSTLPSSFSANVVCNDGTSATVTLPGNGGNGTPVVTGILAGATCTVTETTALPSGSVVTYNPAGANTTGVTITANTQVTVTITNDFAGIQVAPANVVAPPVVAPPVVVQPALTG
jgi:hypothetical protein